jgi:hypothetical protein
MPKSKVRKKVKERAAHSQEAVAEVFEAPKESPKWLAPTMIGLFIIGLLWIVVFYISQTEYPIPGIHAWNMVIGFVFIGAGFSLATRWR